jgi:hypothetical protein
LPRATLPAPADGARVREVKRRTTITVRGRREQLTATRSITIKKDAT